MTKYCKSKLRVCLGIIESSGKPIYGAGLARTTGWHPNTCTKYLEYWKRRGLVERKNEGRKVMYYRKR